MKVRRAGSIRGSVSLPGDKSISHRAAMLSAIAVGKTKISNFSASADCASTLECLSGLGVSAKIDGADVTIEGVGLNGLQRPDGPLDCGNSGTTMRLLAGILAGQEFDSVLTGDDSLNKRPMGRIVRPLSQMGASFASTDGHAPLKIHGRNPLDAIDFETPVASAQIKSAVLLAGLNARGTTTVTESERSRDHTERMFAIFGLPIRHHASVGNSVSVTAAQPASPGTLEVPADISAGAFFMIAAACLPDSEIALPGVGINPTRSAIIDVLKGLGVEIEISNAEVRSNEPTATIGVRGGITARPEDGPARISPNLIPNLIDEIPILAILGTQLAGGLEVRNAAELRHKETDRISAVVKNLELMGASVKEFPDGFVVERSNLQGAKLESYGDHRIAMAFAIAGLIANGETEITDADCADVSFPGFFEILASVVVN